MVQLSAKDQLILDALTSGCVRTCARFISRIERGEPGLVELLRALYMVGGSEKIIGITGPPGAGKSSLVAKVIGVLRRRGNRVAVLAVDPSSPFTGGAILGDRLRMIGHATDPEVFIRSMASRGRLGGLAKKAGDVLTVLSAMPWDFIIVETVGTGQSETEIMHYAAVVVLVQTPMAGDDVQAAKAGINEISDIYVVNKSDHPDADRFRRQLEAMVGLGLRLEGDRLWRPPVVKTQSLVGEGVDELVDQIGQRFRSLAENPELSRQRFRNRLRHRVVEIVREMLERDIQSGNGMLPDSRLEPVLAREKDPYELAREFLSGGT